MRKIISFMHISLDGFVAGLNGELDWVKVDEEIFTHVGKRISEGDTALYGRVTYQMMENYWPTAGDEPTASKHELTLDVFDYYRSTPAGVVIGKSVHLCMYWHNLNQITLNS